MRCVHCGYEFEPGEYLTIAYVYWREEHLGGEAYEDGAKRVGWAHGNCPV